MIDRLLIGTHNPGKRQEIFEALSGLSMRLIGPEEIGIVERPPERGESYLEIARRKANFFYDRAHLPVLADDSGLEVDALGGAPGIHSARYAGPDAADSGRMLKLLGEMAGLEAERRRAEFVCCIALVLDDRFVTEFVGRCTGRILTEQRGSQGFGYDPLFVPAGYDRSFAEMTIEEKRRISHRGQALEQLRQYLESELR